MLKVVYCTVSFSNKVLFNSTLSGSFICETVRYTFELADEDHICEGKQDRGSTLQLDIGTILTYKFVLFDPG